MDETSKNKSTPCKGCERRCAGCHIKCADYAGYRQKLDSEAQRRARERASDPRYMKRPYRERYLKKMMERQKRGRNT